MKRFLRPETGIFLALWLVLMAGGQAVSSAIPARSGIR